MDAALALARLSEETNSLIAEGDFEGAEELIVAALGHFPDQSAFLHFQMGRIYHRWNKLTSAIHHLHHAIEAAQKQNENLILIQIVEELNLVKKVQAGQRP